MKKNITMAATNTNMKQLEKMLDNYTSNDNKNISKYAKKKLQQKLGTRPPTYFDLYEHNINHHKNYYSVNSNDIKDHSNYQDKENIKKLSNEDIINNHLPYVNHPIRMNIKIIPNDNTKKQYKGYLDDFYKNAPECIKDFTYGVGPLKDYAINDFFTFKFFKNLYFFTDLTLNDRVPNHNNFKDSYAVPVKIIADNYEDFHKIFLAYNKVCSKINNQAHDNNAMYKPWAREYINELQSYIPKIYHRYFGMNDDNVTRMSNNMHKAFINILYIISYCYKNKEELKEWALQISISKV